MRSREAKNGRAVFLLLETLDNSCALLGIAELLPFLYFSLYTGGVMKRIIAIILTSAVCGALLFVSCRTIKDIPEDLTSTQLIQLGQNAYGSAQYKNAETYYKTVIARYGIDSSVYVEARYELGHLYLKQKKYAAAYASFKEILDMYASTTPGVLPGAYNKLAEIGMKRIPKNKLPETKPSKVQTDVHTETERTEAAQKAQDADMQETKDADVQESQAAGNSVELEKETPTAE